MAFIKDKIILASQSPRRKQLLQWAEIDFEIMVPGTDESYPGDLATEDVPVHIAAAKARAIREKLDGNHIILAADTIVVLDDQIIGKPADREEAMDILSALSGRQHRVITGVCIDGPDGRHQFHDVTGVTFHPLTRRQIEYYVDHYLPFDKAGAYAIQEWIGVVGIKSVDGDFYNVMGLPVSRVLQALAAITQKK